MTLNTWGRYGPYKERWNFFLEELNRLHPDLICLQEVLDEELTERIKKYLGFSHTLSAYEAGLVTISRFPFFAERVLKYCAASQIEKEDRRAVIAGLEAKSNPFVIANTHLSWRPEDAKTRLLQINELLEELKKEKYPILLAGDFNDTQESETVREIKKRTYQNLLELADPTSPRVTWDNQNPFIQSHRVKFPDREIDFLFGDPEFLKMHPLRNCKIVFNRPNPNGIFPSDHYGIFARI
ncbi:MAG: endonuclease/exonuclease/phosphatase family protein [Candidatus Omnitrophica bacterium]|nr:endonuclease/exonuclease/phosphatase family protein [Candidatus Omnitrophota bacterium]